VRYVVATVFRNDLETVRILAEQVVPEVNTRDAR
jgi:hypothetical protein